MRALTVEPGRSLTARIVDDLPESAGDELTVDGLARDICALNARSPLSTTGGPLPARSG